MGHRVVFFLWLAFCAAGVPHPCFGAEAASRPDAALAGVTALGRPITLSETKIPLGALVQKIAAQTGVRLVAHRDVAAEPVAVVVRRLPARELLTNLAELLDYRWRRLGKPGEWRYEIWQDAAGKRYEQALRRDLAAYARKRLAEEVDHLAALASLSQEQIEGEMEAPMPAFPGASGPPTTEEAQARWQRYTHLIQLWSPTQRSLARFLKRLSAEQWDLLRKKGVLNFSSKPHPGDFPLPVEASRDFGLSPPLAMPAVYFQLTDSATQAKVREQEKKAQALWAAASGYDVMLQHDIGKSFERYGVLTFHAGVDPLLPTEEPLAWARMGPESGTELRLSIRPDQFREPAARDTPGQDAIPAGDPVLSTEQVFRPVLRQKPDNPRNEIPKDWFLDLLPEIARIYGVNIISDAYGISDATYGYVFDQPISLASLLQEMVAERYRWDRRGRLLRLRNRTWYLLRPREAPLRLLQRWVQTYTQRGALFLRDYAEMATALSDIQMEELTESERVTYLPAYEEFVLAYNRRGLLRLYASLTPRQRNALQRGRALSLRQLKPPQRERFRVAIREALSDLPHPPDPRNWTDVSFTMSVKPAPAQSRAGAPTRRGRPQRLEEVQFSFRLGRKVYPAASLTVLMPGRSAAGDGSHRSHQGRQPRKIGRSPEDPSDPVSAGQKRPLVARGADGWRD